MACTIDATVGGASANSYATIAEGTTYHDTHLSADAWTDGGSDKQCRGLQMATRLLDQWFDWYGSPVGSTQALLWPRVGVIGPNGYELANNAIPTLIKHATIELARQLMVEDITADSDAEAKGLQSLTAGPVSMVFRGSATSKPIPDAVMAMVSRLGSVRSRSGSSVTLRRG